MTVALALWFVLSVACDVSGQLCFKIGADRLPDGHFGQVAAQLPREPWLLAGIAIYIVEIFVWLRILAEAPLSVAFPIASLNFIGVTFASWRFLGERVGARQWLGVVLITAGVIVVARFA